MISRKKVRQLFHHVAESVQAEFNFKVLQVLKIWIFTNWVNWVGKREFKIVGARRVWHLNNLFQLNNFFEHGGITFFQLNQQFKTFVKLELEREFQLACSNLKLKLWVDVGKWFTKPTFNTVNFQTRFDEKCFNFQETTFMLHLQSQTMITSQPSSLCQTWSPLLAFYWKIIQVIESIFIFPLPTI